MVESFAANTDYAKLRFRHHGDHLAQAAILQAEMRHRHRRKLSSLLAQSPRFYFPNTLAGEQATGSHLAAEHACLFIPGMRVADLTAGLGIDVLALARLGCRVTAFDIKRENVEALVYNAQVCGLGDMIEVIEGDSIEWLRRHPDAWFDAIFVDPARRDSLGRRVYGLSDCSPDVVACRELILAHTPRMVVKLSPMLDVKALCSELPGVRRVTAIGTSTECKELVAEVEINTAEDLEPEQRAVTIKNDGSVSRLDILRDADAPLIATCAPREGMLLYEPWPAVMKLHPWGTLSANWPQLEMVGVGTSLFISENPVDSVPAEAYEIERVEPFDRRVMKTLSKDKLKTNVAVRNFPLSAPELASRLRITEGGSKKLFGVTGAGKARLLIFAQPLARD